jgi:RecB family exonuclease
MINAFSVSRLKNYEECPYRALLLYGPEKQQVPDDPKRQEALDRGILFHKLAEQYIKGELEDFPRELENYRSVLEEFHEHYVKYPDLTFVETQWCLNDNLETVDWFDSEAWARFGVDYGEYRPESNTILLVDWKTGKRTNRELTHLQQLMAYGACAPYILPHLINEDTKFILRAYYFDSTNTEPFERTTTHAGVMNYAAKLWHRGLTMTQAVEFPPKPNAWNCKYCPFSSNNADTCAYSPDFM